VWQTKRYFEKQELIAQRMTDWHQAPMPYHDYIQQLRKQRDNGNKNTLATTTTSESVSLRRLQVTGRFRHDAEMFVGPRGPPSSAGYSTGGGGSQPSSGYYIVTPFELETTPWRRLGESSDESKVLLVNRGWIPRHLLPHHAPPLDPTERGPGHHQDYPYRHDKHYRHHDSNDDTATAATPETHAVETAPWSRPTGTVQLTVVSTPAESRYTKSRVCACVYRVFEFQLSWIARVPRETLDGKKNYVACFSSLSRLCWCGLFCVILIRTQIYDCATQSSGSTGRVFLVRLAISHGRDQGPWYCTSSIHFIVDSNRIGNDVSGWSGRRRFGLGNDSIERNGREPQRRCGGCQGSGGLAIGSDGYSFD
jgi:SURF1 family